MTALSPDQAPIVRWRILKLLDDSRTFGVDEEGLSWATSQPGPYVRGEMQYLADLHLIEVTKTDEAGEPRPWLGKITAAGTDFVQYRSPRFPGIARPVKGA